MGGGCDNDITWVDGMGGNGLFYNEFPQLACFDIYSYVIVCFWDKGVYVLGGTFCDYETGIGEIKTNDNDFQIYPNPNDGNMMLDFSLDATDKGDITIYDIAGKLIYKYELNASATQIIISHPSTALRAGSGFNNGIYFYRIKVNNKIVKNDKIVIIKQ